MEYTVADLLREKELGTWLCLTEGMDLSNIVIKSCFPHELPMQGFIRPGELIVTSVSEGRQDPEIFRRTIEEAHADGAAAIVLSFPDETRVPDSAVALAQKLGLPLLQVGWDINFTDIQEYVTQAVRNARMTEYVQLQSDMFNAYFNGKTLEGAVHLIAEGLACEAAAADEQKQILCRSDGYLQQTHEYPIKINDQRMGQLLLQMKQDVPDDMEDIVQQYITYPLALWFNRQQVEQQLQLRLKNDFALRLSKEEYSDALIREAGRLGINLDKRYCAVHVIPQIREEQYRTLALRTGELVSAALTLGEQRSLAVIAGEEMGRFTFFVEAPLSGSAHTDHFLELWMKQTAQVLPQTGYFAGISQPFDGMTGFSKGYREAVIAASYCSEDQPRIHYEEARKIRIMSAVAGQPQIREDAEKILGRILSYDKGGGSMELMKTLSAYFRSGGNTSRTARELIIHRQSLLKRLEKIEDLTGLSLKHEDDRFVLEVYSRLYLNY